MQGYLIERLYPTGWRRDGQIWWRFADAAVECERAIAEDMVRGIRILACRVDPDAVHERLVERQEAQQ